MAGNPNWVKGKSGNPGGTASNVGGYNLPQLCRIKSKAAFDTISKIMQDETAPHQARLKAAEMILDRGFGKAIARSVEMSEHKTALELTDSELADIVRGVHESLATSIN